MAYRTGLLNRRAFWFFLAPAVILYSVFVMLPIIQSSFFSFHQWDGIGGMTFIGLGNYQRMLLEDQLFYKAAGNTFRLLLFSLLQLPLGLAFAVWLAKKRPGHSFFKTVIFMPVVVPTVVLGILWSQIYNPISGPLNSGLSALGLSGWCRAWLGEPATALPSIVLVVVWQMVGFYMVVYLAGIQGISSEVLEAAAIDGASSRQITARIIVPMLSNTIGFTLIFNIITSLRYFDLIYVMTRGGPNHTTEVIATYMFHEAFNVYHYGYASAIAFVLFGASLLVSLAVIWGGRREAHA